MQSFLTGEVGRRAAAQLGTGFIYIYIYVYIYI